MRKFDRIVTDYQKLGGLPHFRDTNITVSEVVRLVMDGKPNADILARYPDLEPEDIQEALAFAVDSLVKNIGITRFEMAGKLGVIHGSIAILSDVDNLEDEEQEQLIQMCQQSIGPATRLIYQLQDWSRFVCFDDDNDDLVLNLPNILQNMIEELGKSETTIELNFEVSPNFQGIRADIYRMKIALGNLIAGEDLYFFDHQASVEINDSSDCLNIIVRRNSLERYSLSDTENQIKHFLEHSTSLAIAALIIHQHGSELKITPDDTGATFAFELPVWQGDEI